jgi:hypothetical protein
VAFEESSIRARFMQTAIAHLASLPGDAPARAAAGLGESATRVIRASPAMGFVDARLILDLVDVLHDLLPGRAVQTYWETLYRRIVEVPLFSGLLRAAASFVVGRPDLGIEVFARGWALNYRNGGQIEVLERGEREVRFAIAPLPPALFAHVRWHRVNAMFIDGMFQDTKVDGVSTYEGTDPARRAALYRMRWA